MSPYNSPSSLSTGIVGTSGQTWQEQQRFMLYHLRNFGVGKSSYEPVIVEEIAELMDHLAKEEGRPVQMIVSYLPNVYALHV